GKARVCAAFRPLIAPDPVPTAGEEAVGFMDISSDIAGEGYFFEPQEYPFPAISPMLGTPVGSGIAGFQDWLPMWVPKDANARTFEPFVNLSTALTAAHAFGYGVGLRWF
ncbi:MAG: hypothetical protein AAB368_13285, partial [bacterium]